MAPEGGPFMHVTVVDSTTLARVAYDESRELLQVQFRSRAIYQHFGVPAGVHKGLLEAPSKGGYCNRFIRGRYLYSLSLASHEQGRARSGGPVLERRG
jgi:hypothetical protein